MQQGRLLAKLGRTGRGEEPKSKYRLLTINESIVDITAKLTAAYMYTTDKISPGTSARWQNFDGQTQAALDDFFVNAAGNVPLTLVRPGTRAELTVIKPRNYFALTPENPENSPRFQLFAKIVSAALPSEAMPSGADWTSRETKRLERLLPFLEKAYQQFVELGRTLPVVEQNYGIDAKAMTWFFGRYLYATAKYAEIQERKALKLLKDMPRSLEQLVEMGEQAVRMRDEFFDACDTSLKHYGQVFSIVDRTLQAGLGDQAEILDAWKKWAAGHVTRIMYTKTEVAQRLNLRDIEHNRIGKGLHSAEQTTYNAPAKPSLPIIGGPTNWEDRNKHIGNYILPTIRYVPRGYIPVEQAAQEALPFLALSRRTDKQGRFEGFDLVYQTPVGNRSYYADEYIRAMLDQACGGKLEVVRLIGMPSVYVSKKSLGTFIKELASRQR